MSYLRFQLAARVLLWSLLAATLLWGTSIYLAQQDRLIDSVHMPTWMSEPVRIGYHPSMIGFMEGDYKLGITTDGSLEVCFIDFAAKIQPEDHCHPAVKGPTIP